MAHAISLNRLALGQGALWISSGLVGLGKRLRPIHLLAAVPIAGALLWRRRRIQQARMWTEPQPRIDADRRIDDVGQFDIAPGETRMADGHRDLVTEASMESFPGSDPPAIGHSN